VLLLVERLIIENCSRALTHTDGWEWDWVAAGSRLLAVGRCSVYHVIVVETMTSSQPASVVIRPRVTWMPAKVWLVVPQVWKPHTCGTTNHGVCSHRQAAADKGIKMIQLTLLLWQLIFGLGQQTTALLSETRENMSNDTW